MSMLPKDRAPSKASTRKTKQPPEKKKKPKSDLRKQLVNGGKVGVIERVSLPEDMITSLRGIMLDIDPGLFRRALVPDKVRNDSERFYKTIVQPWLRRHPVLSSAEVRATGRGLHVIINLSTPIELETEGQRQYWSGVVKTLQKLLPTDPDCPGITALTRALGSVNSKNGIEVCSLEMGQPVTQDEVLALFDQVRTSPFRTIAKILFGAEQITPCPVCGGEGSRLDALDHVGKCYGGCGKVRLGQLFDVFLKPRPKQEG